MAAPPADRRWLDLFSGPGRYAHPWLGQGADLSLSADPSRRRRRAKGGYPGRLRTNRKPPARLRQLPRLEDVREEC
jgi:hypothetical protein